MIIYWRKVYENRYISTFIHVYQNECIKQSHMLTQFVHKEAILYTLTRTKVIHVVSVELCKIVPTVFEFSGNIFVSLYKLFLASKETAIFVRPQCTNQLLQIPQIFYIVCNLLIS